MFWGIPIFYLVLVASFGTGIAKYKNIEPTYFKWSVLYLLMNVVVETYGLISKASGKNNYWAYNLSTIVEFTFYYYLFYNATTNLSHKKNIGIIGSITLLFCIVNIFFIQGLNHFHSNSFVLGSLSLIYLSVCYFIQQSDLEEPSNPFTKKMFWITTGVLFFYTGTIFNLGLFEYIHLKNSLLEKQFSILLNCLNSLLYIFYIIAFLFCK